MDWCVGTFSPEAIFCIFFFPPCPQGRLVVQALSSNHIVVFRRRFPVEEPQKLQLLWRRCKRLNVQHPLNTKPCFWCLRTFSPSHSQTKSMVWCCLRIFSPSHSQTKIPPSHSQTKSMVWHHFVVFRRLFPVEEP